MLGVGGVWGPWPVVADWNLRMPTGRSPWDASQVRWRCGGAAVAAAAVALPPRQRRPFTGRLATWRSSSGPALEGTAGKYKNRPHASSPPVLASFSCGVFMSTGRHGNLVDTKPHQ